MTLAILRLFSESLSARDLLIFNFVSYTKVTLEYLYRPIIII